MPSLPPIYVPPHQPSSSFKQSLDTTITERHPSTPDADLAYHASQALRPPITQATTPPISFFAPPPSPRPSFRGVLRHKDPRCPRRLRLNPPSRKRNRPRLKITNPRTRPVYPCLRPAPSYHLWHPTSVVWEYQLLRGLGVTERVFELCRFFNRASGEKEGRVGDEGVWKGHEGRVEWLFWYWEQWGKRRVREMETAMERAEGFLEDVVDWEEDLRDGDELTNEEKEMVEKLKEEMGEELEAGSMTNGNGNMKIYAQEETDGKGFTDMMAWAPNAIDEDGWWKPQKRKRIHGLDHLG
ncbi:MAG: hypothetical protein LQ338_003301 [Usnochroma carphineum]|nr:MAG: hypothetical protein LQ338_003301 [Usnochroma carphineum]